MRLRLILLSLLPTLLVSHPSLAQDYRPIVAVFQIDAKDAGLTKKKVRQFTEYLGAAISEKGILRVIPPEDIKRALVQQKNASYKNCVDERCQIELGRELAANKSLATRIMKIGKECIVTLRLYDLKSGATDTSATETRLCRDDKILESLRIGASSIRKWAKGVGYKAPKPVGLSKSIDGAPGKPKPQGPLGILSRSDIMKTIRANKPKVIACYNRQLKKTPNLKGLVQVKMTVSPTGKMDVVEIKKDSIADEDLRACIVKEIKTWIFPKPKGGFARFTFPFYFKPS